MSDTAEIRKARGAFFTPPRISEFLVDWAIRTPTDSVMEPSCGEASFLLAAGRKLSSLGTDCSSVATQLHGIEIHAQSAVNAKEILSLESICADIKVQDFFSCEPSEPYDVVVGNPPYVRYQESKLR